jgi:4-hydroxybenzoate polyprenyltransferase
MIKEYAKLSSAHFALLTAMIPLSGALVMGETRVSHLLLLFVIGLLAHIYGFAFNHYNDITIDGLTPQLKERPLPRGTIKKNHALLYIVTVLILGFLLTFYFYDIRILMIYSVGILLATIYDVFSKKIGGMDFLLAASITLSAVFGSATVSFDFTHLTYIIWILAFIQTVNFNMIAGGIKDADHDFLLHSKHLSTALGVKVKGGMLHVPTSFKTVAYLFAVLYALVVFLPLATQWITIPILFILALLVVNILFFYITYKMMRTRRFDRQEIRTYVVLHYTINWLNVPILLLAITPISVILILFPLLGLIVSNILLYKTIFRPKMM